jgi:hypothetical protein
MPLFYVAMSTKDRVSVWFSQLSEAERACWNAMPQPVKQQWLKTIRPENIQRALQMRLSIIDTKIDQHVLDLTQAILLSSGLSSRVACALRSDERFLSINGKGGVEISFYWNSGYWKFLKGDEVQRIDGGVLDLIEFMESEKLIPETESPKKGQLELWD